MNRSPDDNPRIQKARPSLIVILAVVLFSSFLISMWPAFSAPIAADDRYWSIEIPAQFEGSFVNVLTGTWEDTPAFMRAGRLTPLANLGRRVLGLAIFQFSLVTSTPIVVIQAIAKLILLGMGVLTSVAFIASLRWRSDPGPLVRANPATLIIAATGLTALLAVGVSSHQQFRNGWVSYPLLTYGGAIVVFGSAALTVLVARRLAQNKRGAYVVAVATSILLAAILNWTYELYYVGFPLSLLVLFAFPLTPDRGSKEQRKARLLVGGVLSVSFLAGFAWTRMLVSGVCSGDECYQGTTMALGPQTIRTAWYNLVSAVPGTSGSEFRRDVEGLDPSALQSGIYVGELWIVSLALGISTWLIWRWATTRWPSEVSERKAESRLLLVAGAAATAVGLGGAIIMSVSVQSQEVIDRIGIPYRHTVLTWTALSVAIVLLVRSFDLAKPSMRSGLAVGLVCCMLIAASVFTLPRNVLATRVYRNTPPNTALSQIHWEVIAGDPHPLGDERRCLSFQRAEESINNPWLEARLEPAADKLFQRLYDMPFCSTWSPPTSGKSVSP